MHTIYYVVNWTELNPMATDYFSLPQFILMFIQDIFHFRKQ